MSKETLRAIQEATHDLDLSSIIGLVVLHRDWEIRLCWPLAGDEVVPGLIARWSASCEVEVEFDGMRTALGEGDTPREALDACADAADLLDEDGEQPAARRPSTAQRPLNVQLPAGLGVKNDMKLERWLERGVERSPAVVLPPTNDRPVERLDLSKPPPGYDLAQLDEEWRWGETPEWLDGTSYLDHNVALAAAWAHHETRKDPPGLEVLCLGERTYAALLDAAGVQLNLGDKFESEASARDFAWRYAKRRIVLADRLEREFAVATTRLYGDLNVGLPSKKTPLQVWPRALTWSDEQTAEVEAWIVDPTAELPEVLRG